MNFDVVGPLWMPTKHFWDYNYTSMKPISCSGAGWTWRSVWRMMWFGWVETRLMEVRWEAVFQPLGPMSWLPRPPPTQSLHPTHPRPTFDPMHHLKLYIHPLGPFGHPSNPPIFLPLELLTPAQSLFLVSTKWHWSTWHSWPSCASAKHPSSLGPKLHSLENIAVVSSKLTSGILVTFQVALKLSELL